jgi:hypothetical protein
MEERFHIHLVSRIEPEAFLALSDRAQALKFIKEKLSNPLVHQMLVSCAGAQTVIWFENCGMIIR